MGWNLRLGPFPVPSQELESLATLLPVAASQILVTNVSAIRSEEGRTEPESVSECGLIPHRESALGCFAQCVRRELSNELKV